MTVAPETIARFSRPASTRPIGQPKAVRHRLTEEQEQRIADLRAWQYSWTEIARRVGSHADTVKKAHARVMRPDYKRWDVTASERARIVSMRRDGATIPEIVAEVGRCKSTVWNACNAAGLPRIRAQRGTVKAKAQEAGVTRRAIHYRNNKAKGRA